MTLQRSPFAGDTNYMGASLEDIVAHLKDWRKSTQDTIEILKKYRPQILEKREGFDNPDSIVDFIDYFINRLERYLNDFDRLIRELPLSVEERHVELIKRLADYSKALDDTCVDFKQDHIRSGIKNERMRPLVDVIYSEARSQAIDYQDLFNVASQLKTFIGTRNESGQVSIDDVDALELKPNVFGIGVNVNHLIKRLGQWWKKKKAKSK
jgi:hypothetical protein